MKTIYHHLICPFQRHRCNAFLISSLSKGRGDSKRAFFMRIDEPHRGSAFDSPGLASIASYPGLICCVGTQRRRCCTFLISSFQKGDEMQADHVCRIPACVHTLTQSHINEKVSPRVG